MTKYVLDTNVYIRAIRDADARAELAAWQRVMGPRLYQHAVVVSELLVGARDGAAWRRWHARWVLPAERVRRVFTPSYATWLEASRILSRLAELGRIVPGSVTPGFANDCLLAASAREEGFVVVTHNRTDFERIREVAEGVRVMEPLP